MRIQILILACLVVLSCQTSNQTVEKKKYSNDVGDILFNSLSDNKDFQICDSLNMSTSRRGLAYLDQNGSSVEFACKQKFTYQPVFESFSGFVTVRFIVNCQLETDRFRAQSLAFDFTEKDCPKALKDHLVQIVSELDGWAPAYARYEGLDFAKYLNFKIENGRITNVLQ